MAVKHTFRNPEGGLTSKGLTGMSAIRLFCLECVGWNTAEVKNCTSKYCPLFPFRFGNMKEEGTAFPKNSPEKASGYGFGGQNSTISP